MDIAKQIIDQRIEKFLLIAIMKGIALKLFYY